MIWALLVLKIRPEPELEKMFIFLIFSDSTRNYKEKRNIAHSERLKLTILRVLSTDKNQLEVFNK